MKLEDESSARSLDKAHDRSSRERFGLRPVDQCRRGENPAYAELSCWYRPAVMSGRVSPPSVCASTAGLTSPQRLEAGVRDYSLALAFSLWSEMCLFATA